MRDERESMALKVAALVTVVATAPINAFIGAWSLAKLWQWFLSVQYGAGPSLGAWFGIGSILSLLASGHLLSLSREKEWQTSIGVITRSLVMPVIYLSVLLVAWSIGSIMGWIA